MTFFIPLAKIDEEKRLVIGRAVQEVVDRTNEILDYASAKPAFEKWSKEFEDLSGGLSKGNVRVMHDPKRVAGKLVDLAFKDDEKAIDVVAKVVDDDAWKKVLEGVFTGFSVGGGYGKKWKDPDSGATRYTPVVTEISLVDNPCIPTARIAELHKASGVVEELRLTGRARTFDEIYRPAPRGFDEVLAGGDPVAAPSGPRTFDQLMLAKAWREEAHPREHDGKFARKTGEIAGGVGGALALGVGGLLLGRRYGASIGQKLGRIGGRVASQNPITRIDYELTGMGHGRKYGPAVGAVAGMVGGAAGGAAVGAGGDRYFRNRRADRAYQERADEGSWTQEEADAAKALYRRSKGRGIERQRRIEERADKAAPAGPLAKKAPRALRAAAVPLKRAWRAVGNFGARAGAITGMATAPRNADLATILVRGARGGQVGRRTAQAVTAGAGLGVAGYAAVGAANRMRGSRQLSEAEIEQRREAGRASGEKRKGQGGVGGVGADAPRWPHAAAKLRWQQRMQALETEDGEWRDEVRGPRRAAQIDRDYYREIERRRAERG
jgi:hypothetical protein